MKFWSITLTNNNKVEEIARIKSEGLAWITYQKIREVYKDTEYKVNIVQTKKKIRSSKRNLKKYE